MRLVRNDRIPADQVDELKEDLEYYIDSHQEDDYMMAYDEDGFYESLGLDELDIVNVDRVTQANTPATRKKDDDATSASSGSKVEKNSKKTPAATGMIPLTIGRARSAKADKEKGPTSSNEATPTKIGRSNSGISATNGGGGINAPAVVGPTPTPKPPASPPGAGGASMAAVLRRESEERARAAQLLAQQQEQAALQQQQQAAEQLRQQQLQKQQQQHAETQRLQQAETLRQQLEAQQKAIAVAAQQAEALKRQQMMMEQRQAAAQMQQQQQDAAAKQKLLQQQAQAAPQQVAQAQQQNVINNGLSSLSLSNAIGPSSASTAIASTGIATSNTDSTERYLHALNESFLQIPTSTETERAKSYTPRNPYPAAPSCYPSTPSPILDNPAVFEKLGTDALFFIFYYAQGTYQQYLAARELKKQSWRYHKKYMTWFQRHEEPKVTTGDYEQGTYVYFDYETGWCQRIKSDFRFEYSFLEDSLSV